MSIFRIPQRLFRSISLFTQGIVDGISFHKYALYYFTSSDVRAGTVQCIVLNGIIFSGSLLVYYKLVEPTIEYLLVDQVNPAYVSISSLVYSMLWTYPMYVVTTLLNTIWYDDIARAAYKVHPHDRDISDRKKSNKTSYQR